MNLFSFFYSHRETADPASHQDQDGRKCCPPAEATAAIEASAAVEDSSTCRHKRDQR